MELVRLVGALYNPDHPIVPEDSDTVRHYRYTSFPGGGELQGKISPFVQIQSPLTFLIDIVFMLLIYFCFRVPRS